MRGNSEIMLVRSCGVVCAVLLCLTACSYTPEAKRDKFLALGKTHVSQQDYSRALLDFRNAIQAMPKAAEPHYQLGLALLKTGAAQSAVFEFQKAIQLDPKHVEARLRLAEIMSLNGNTDVVRQAQKKAEEALSLSPGNADALNALAVTELRLEDPDDAAQHLKEALEKSPQHLNASMTLAMMKLRQNDVAGAEQVMEKSAAEAPRSADHAFALGRFYTFINKTAEAEKQFRRAVEIDPKYGPAWVSLGAVLLHAGKTAEADQAYARASALPDRRLRPIHAMFLLETGKTDAALAELEQQYKADGNDRDARTRLVSANLQSGRTAEAQKILTDALSRNVRDTDALIQRAELNLNEKRYQDAQRDISEALRFKPDSASAHLTVARIYQARGAAAAQRQELTEALRLDPKLLAARIELARALTLSGAANSAVEVLDQAPQGQVERLPVILERNVALFKLRNYAAARKGIDKGLSISRSAALLLQEGVLKLTQKDYTGARTSFEEVLKQQPEEWRALEALAGSYVAQRNIVQATTIIREHTSKLPRSASAQYFLGAWLARTGDRAGARVAFEAAKALDAKSARSDVALAELDVAEGKLDTARNTFTSALGREPQNVNALVGLAEVEQRAGNASIAMEYYDKVVQQDPKNLLALNNLAYLLADSGKDLDRAVQIAQQVKEMDPDNAAIDDTIGWAYYNKGLYQTSVEYLKRAAASGSATRKCHLAMAEMKVGNRQEALTILQAVLQEQPSSPEARKVLGLLGGTR